ncbi:MAG: nucleotidyltransferase domain-containing protein, partial [bacterium]
MAQNSSAPLQPIKNYVKALIKDGIRVQQVFLYGSHAKNRAHEDSDIDIIVVSEDFNGKRLLERLQILGWARREVPEPVQAYG